LAIDAYSLRNLTGKQTSALIGANNMIGLTAEGGGAT